MGWFDGQWHLFTQSPLQDGAGSSQVGVQILPQVVHTSPPIQPAVTSCWFAMLWWSTVYL